MSLQALNKQVPYYRELSEPSTILLNEIIKKCLKNHRYHNEKLGNQGVGKYLEVKIIHPKM